MEKLKKYSKAEVTNVSDEFIIDLIFNDLSFERDFVTRDEVAAVVNNQTKGIDAQKVTAINNQHQAFLKVLNLVNNDQPITEELIKDLHAILVNDLDKLGGLYRNVDLYIKGSQHTPPSHLKVRQRMKRYLNELEAPLDHTDELALIAYTHLELAKIHPFIDANGRLARLILNYQLMLHGYRPICIDHQKRYDYFGLLEKYKVEKEIQPFIDFLIEKLS